MAKYGTLIKDGVIYSGGGGGGGATTITTTLAELEQVGNDAPDGALIVVEDEEFSGGAGSSCDCATPAFYDSMEAWNEADHSDIKDDTIVYIPEETDLSIKNTVTQCIESTEGSDVAGASALAEAYQTINGNLSYSTTEQKVGTWIDGKPIYRKVMSIVLDDTTGNKVIGEIGEFSQIVKANFITELTDGVVVDGAIYRSTEYTPFNIGYIRPGGSVRYKSQVEQYFGATVTAIIEYVK